MTDPAPAAVQASDFIRGQIQQLSPTRLKAPKNIIVTVQGAKAIYYQYRTEHLKRIDLCAAIEGLIAGNPPYNPVDLAKHKLSHISNFNNLDARSLYERGALAYWNLLNEAQTLVKFTLTWPGSPPELQTWAGIMERHWSEVVRSWPSFNVVFNTLTGQLVKMGVSPVIWPDERDWRWRTIEYPRFFVEDQAQSDIELVTCICVESVFTAQYLWDCYEQYKDVPRDKSPWNIEELSNLLVWLANTFAKVDFQFYDMMDIQRRLQNGDLTFNAIFTDTIRIVSFFQREYDGGVSHYMFHPRYDTGGFIYFADRQYKTMGEGILIFTASPGEFTIHSNRGLGHKIFSGAQAMMQLDCSIVDMARMSSTPLIKSPASGVKDFEAIRFYPGVPTNVGLAEFQENTLGANISQLIAASQFILNKLQFNTANSGDDPSIPDKSLGSVSPSQARMQSYKEFSVLKNNIAHFYTQFDLVVRNMTIKMLNSKKGFPGYEYAAQWKKRCIDDGVPEEIFQKITKEYFGLPDHIHVRATRVAGDGSTLANIMGLQELLPIAPTFSAKAAEAYKRDWIIATRGPEYVAQYTDGDGISDEQDAGASLAGVENAVMRAGESPVFTMSNQHRAHFVTHMALGNDTVRRIQQQQMTPVEADKIFAVLIPHMGEHFEVLAKDMFAQQFVGQVEKPWGQLQQYATLNRKNAAKMIQTQIKQQQEQQQATQQVLSDEEIKNLKAQGDERRADFKVQAQVQRADQANQNRAEVMREKVQEESRNERLKIGLEAKNTTLAEQTQALENKPLGELRQDLSGINGSTVSPFDIE